MGFLFFTGLSASKPVVVSLVVKLVVSDHNSNDPMRLSSVKMSSKSGGRLKLVANLLRVVNVENLS